MPDKKIELSLFPIWKAYIHPSMNWHTSSFKWHMQAIKFGCNKCLVTASLLLYCVYVCASAHVCAHVHV